MRLASVGGIIEHIGRPIDWAEGIEMGPHGEELRQVVHNGMSFECNTWCSRDGVMYDRLYDPFNNTFVWSSSKSMSLDAASDKFKTTLGMGTNARVVRLTRAIALAWLECPKSTTRLQACLAEGSEETYDNIGWIRAGARQFEPIGEREEPETHPFEDDTWKPLKYTWKNQAGEPIHLLTESEYMVSRRAWIRSPHGRASRGIRGPDQRMWIAIEHWGSVWIDEAVLYSFEVPCDSPHCCPCHVDGDASNSKLENLVWVSRKPNHSRLNAIIKHVEEGHTVATICETESIRRSYAWDILLRICRECDLDAIRTVTSMIPREILQLVRDVFRKGDVDVSDRLARMSEVCGSRLCQHRVWGLLGEEDRLGILKVARALCIRFPRDVPECLSRKV